jgi:cytochrome c oxidase subunit II
MGFSLPDFKLRTDIVPGEVARLRLTPDRVGSFEFVCDNFCGEFHEDMSGKIRVTA